MVWASIGGAESGDFGGAYTPVPGGGDSIDGGSKLAGTYAFETDPVNGAGATEYYGWTSPVSTILGFNPEMILVLFAYKYDADFDVQVSIAELGGIGGGGFSRRISQTTAEEIQLLDTDEDSIGVSSGSPLVVSGVTYWFCWYADLRGGTRDIVWIWDNVAPSPAWNKIIDVRGHGDIGNPITNLTFGTYVGKGLPGSGGPFYTDSIGLCALNVEPNTTPLGSLTVRYAPADGDAPGTHQDWNAGADGGGGWGNPDSRNVEQVPHDGATTHDESTALNDQVSYDFTDTVATPIALQIIGVVTTTVAGFPPVGVGITPYLLESGTEDYGTQTGPSIAYGKLDVFTTFNEINGNPLSSALVDGAEVGVEITARPAPATQVGRVTQLGVEYASEGPLALPDDFPPGSLIIPTRPMGPLIVR